MLYQFESCFRLQGFNIYEPFGLGRFATDYSTASRSRVFNGKQQQ